MLQFVSKNIDGLIIAPCGEESEHLIKAQNEGLPLICIDRYFEDCNLSFVSSDNYEGAYSATKYLIQQGHENIACIQGVRHSVPNKQRAKVFGCIVRRRHTNVQQAEMTSVNKTVISNQNCCFKKKTSQQQYLL